MRKLKTIPGMMILLMLIFCQCFSVAEHMFEEGVGDFPVTLTLLSPVASDTRMFEAELFIRMADSTYVSGSLYASYHLYPTANHGTIEESLQFDAPIYVPVKPDANGEARVTVKVDASNLDIAEMYVHYDVLDDENHWWLGFLPGVMNQDAQTLVQYTPLAELLSPLKNAWGKGPVMFVINGIVFAAAFVGIIIIKRRKLLDY